MTTVAVLADPPRAGLVLPELAEATPLSAADAADLYAAMLRDVATGVADSGGDLLINYRGDDHIPAEFAADESAEAQLRAAVRPALSTVDDVRFEVQVGSTFAARAGNTVTHLLEQEGVDTAAVVEPTTPFLSRQVIDNAAMKLRRHQTVLGPADDGRVYYAGFAAPIDFADAYEPPEVETLTDRATEADHDVDFLPMLPIVETAADLATVLSQIRAREAAGRNHPTHTAEFLREQGVSVATDGDGLRVARE